MSRRIANQLVFPSFTRGGRLVRYCGNNWNSRALGSGWGLDLRKISIVDPKVLQVVRLQTSNQFLTALCLQRPSEVNLAHLFQPPFGKNAGEHQQRPGEIGPIHFLQFPEPHNDRTGAPGDGAPPAILAGTQVHLPAFH